MSGIPSVAQSAAVHRPVLTWREEMTTVVFSAWTLVGVFLDGWAHGILGVQDTFFTPWHAVFYSGFLAMCLWVGYIVVRNRRDGRRGVSAVPIAYDLAIVGLILFGGGAIADLLWHEVFGIEEAGERLASPAHLVLFIGGMLAVTAPFRAAWAGAGPNRPAPTFWGFAPALFSLGLSTAAASFFFLNVWGFLTAEYLSVAHFNRLVALMAPTDDARRALAGMAQARALGSIVITTLLLLAPVLLVIRRWKPPFGTAALLFANTTLWMSGLVTFRFIEAVPVALMAGLATDLAISAWRPSFTRPGTVRTIAILSPVVLWGGYFGVTALRWGLTVSPEMWVGALFLSAMTGWGLSLVMQSASADRALQASA